MCQILEREGYPPPAPSMHKRLNFFSMHAPLILKTVFLSKMIARQKYMFTMRDLILYFAKGSFNNYVTHTRVGGALHFVTSIVRPIVLNNRMALQMGGWGSKIIKISVT